MMRPLNLRRLVLFGVTAALLLLPVNRAMPVRADPTKQPVGQSDATHSAATHSAAYDLLLSSYGPHVSQTDPTGWAMKVRSVAIDPFKFWRGTKDLFFHWANTNCADWVRLQDAYVPSHGDLHPGNIGTYFAGNTSTLAFGMIDFDDASPLPLHLELLGGMVTYELIAQIQNIEPTAEDRAKLAEMICSTYFSTLKDNRPIGEIVAGDPVVNKLLGKLGHETYADELKLFTDDRRFRRFTGKPDRIRDVLTCIDDRKDEIAAGLAQAMLNSPRFGQVVNYTSKDQFAAAIKSIVRRTRIDSSGSQGLEKIFVLLDKPIKGMDHDVIFYLKQQLPSAAMRAGLIPQPKDLTPGQRTFELMNQMNQPNPLFSGFVDISGPGGAKSYWVSIKEPWTDSLDYDDVKDVDSMLAQARLWAIVAARSHAGDKSLDLQRFDTPELREQLLARSGQYLAHSNQSFKAFVADPRTKQQVAHVRTFLQQLGK